MRVLTAICTAFAVGLHWVLLQCVAWIGMAVVYSGQEGSVVEGLAMTFDGKHPCAVCHALDAAQESEHGKSPAAPSGKVDVKFVACVGEREKFFIPRLPRDGFGRGPASFGRAIVRASEPPYQPPRSA